MDKDRILAEIRRTAEENGGVPLGQDRFQSETGISIGSWRGKHWRRWSEAVSEAGLTPNERHEARERSELLEWLARLARVNGHFPTYADIRIAKTTDARVPRIAAFSRLGDLAERIEVLRDYAKSNADYSDVLELLPSEEFPVQTLAAKPKETVDGAVYMAKHGKHYKIGKTFSFPRRHRELQLELPEKLEPIHVITTDDPSGIEAYWHNRFATKRTNGAWFALNREDIRAFRRRKFM